MHCASRALPGGGPPGGDRSLEGGGQGSQHPRGASSRPSAELGLSRGAPSCPHTPLILASPDWMEPHCLLLQSQAGTPTSGWEEMLLGDLNLVSSCVPPAPQGKWCGRRASLPRRPLTW